MARLAPSEIIAKAFAASAAAGLAQFERDGRKDCGSCGGYMLLVDGRSPVAKEIVAAGQGRKSDGGTVVYFPAGDCPSQHMEIQVQAGKAARDVFERHGVRVTRAYSYID